VSPPPFRLGWGDESSGFLLTPGGAIVPEWPERGNPNFGGVLRVALTQCVSDNLVGLYSLSSSGGDAGPLEPGSAFAFPTCRIVRILETIAFNTHWFVDPANDLDDANAPFDWLCVDAMRAVPLADRLLAYAHVAQELARGARQSDFAAFECALCGHIVRAWSRLVLHNNAGDVGMLQRSTREVVLTDARNFLRCIDDIKSYNNTLPTRPLAPLVTFPDRYNVGVYVPDALRYRFDFDDLLHHLNVVVDVVTDVARRDSTFGRSSILRERVDPFSSGRIP
jgi:hypothetical protein